jgi:hypothetical protein
MPFTGPPFREIIDSLFDQETREIVQGDGDPIGVMVQWSALVGKSIKATEFAYLEGVLRGPIRDVYHALYDKMTSTQMAYLSTTWPFLTALYAHSCLQDPTPSVSQIKLLPTDDAMLIPIVKKHPSTFKTMAQMHFHNGIIVRELAWEAIKASTQNLWYVKSESMPPSKDLCGFLNEKDPSNPSETRMETLVAFYVSDGRFRDSVKDLDLPLKLLGKVRTNPIFLPFELGVTLAFYACSRWTYLQSIDVYIRARLLEPDFVTLPIEIHFPAKFSQWRDTKAPRSLEDILKRASQKYYLKFKMWWVLRAHKRQTLLNMIPFDLLVRILNECVPLCDALA